MLVHSPVVGPSTWRWVAEALRAHGHDVVVPDLVAAALTGDPRVFARRAVDASRSEDERVVVGHSGAGAVLPSIAASLGAGTRRIVFVDAALPPCEGTFHAGGDFLPTLRDLSSGGTLPVWSRWWGVDTMHALIRDDARRHDIERELPAIPLSFYEQPIEVPSGWCTTPGAYVVLSPAYSPDAARAALLGWPVAERLGTHLDIVNDEAAIAHILVDVCELR